MMLNPVVEETIQSKYEQLALYLNETSIRMWAAVEAQFRVWRDYECIAPLSRTTIHAGVSELEHGETESS